MTTLHQVLQLLRPGRWNAAHHMVQDDGSLLAAWHSAYPGRGLEDAKYWYGQAVRHFRSRGTQEEEIDRFEAELLKSDHLS